MWNEFYAQRVNSTYQKYFEKKYAPFLEAIKKEQKHVLDEGCGIGSIGKYIRSIDDVVPRIYKGYDVDLNMLYLAEENTTLNMPHDLWQDDILNPDRKINLTYLRVTHGVLEHFTDDEICKIFQRYKDSGVTSIHYVPLDKYKVPSIGDERLLIWRHWIMLAERYGDVQFELFNEDFDLYFKIKP